MYLQKNNFGCFEEDKCGAQAGNNARMSVENDWINRDSRNIGTKVPWEVCGLFDGHNVAGQHSYPDEEALVTISTIVHAATWDQEAHPYASSKEDANIKKSFEQA